MNAKNKEKILQIISEALELEEQIGEEDSMENIGEWDSLGHLSILIYLDKEFGHFIIREREYMGVGTGNANRLVIEGNTGCVGLGNITNPTAILDINSDIFRTRTAKTPASAGAAGNTGDRAWDTNFFYICIATNSWRRVAHNVW